MNTANGSMATRSLFLLLLYFSIPISTLGIAEAGDEAALLAFKSAASSGGGGGGAYSRSLASWNSSSSSGFCSWEGVTCGRRHRRVVALSLRSHELAGVLSPAIGNLSFLRTLDLSGNGMRGHIPASLGRLRHLRLLNLSNNAFSGELLLANLSSCTRLRTISLQKNQLQGRVPSELSDGLTHLEELTLWGNNFTGTIPASLANLSSLCSLQLAMNQLDGTIPPVLGHMLGLKYLALAYNYLSGEPPVSLYNLSLLKALQIQGNMFHGGIPTNIGSNLPNMQILDFSENLFTGSIPFSLSNLTALELLDLSRNRLSGNVPQSLGPIRALERLYLYTNKLEANREGWEFISSLSNCSQLQYLVIGDNAAFVGRLPTSIVNLSVTLQVLVLDETGISGSIPSAISNLVSLELLGLSNTSISDRVPDSIGKLGSLVQLRLHNTRLSGLIPSSIGNLSHLTLLRAYNCNLEGPIPASIGKLENLIVLDLSMNRLNGSIPVEIFKLPLLSIFLNLSYNSLSGPLPSEVSSMGNLNNLVLSGNRLSGEIPDGIGECTVLQGLWLDNNSFEGSIPQSINKINGLIALNLSTNKLSGTIPIGIGSIQNLQQLYMAHNNLSGTIPTVLQSLTSLLELDLSFNNLQGEVPREGVFRNLTYMAITGNNELCGGIPQLHLAPCHKNSAKKDSKEHLKIALSAIGGLLSLAFVIPLIQFLYNKLRQKHKSVLQPQITEEQYERVSYHTLANGTNGFSEANLLGEGSFGAVYKCTFQDEGTIVAVKVFNLEQSGSSRSFVAECEAMRMVRHRCLLKIITCCSSINHQGQEFKALIFEFMPNGSLYVWLHPEPDVLNLRNTLSLTQRLNIAVDIIDALDYLHNHCQTPIIHCDLKPSNILLAEDMSARVGDFGISRILPGSASKTLQNSNSTIGIRGSIGYVAPEYGEGSSISTQGDVYSLGILLLEIFTGRSPTDEMFSGALDLHKFSRDALPMSVWGIVDPNIWMHTDADNSTTRSRIQNCLVSVLALGISCSKKQPRERITIQDAAIEMHAIRDSFTKFARSQFLEHGLA